jgi:hypothetical protein
MKILVVEEVGAWETRKRIIVDMMVTLNWYATGDDASVPIDNQLCELMLAKMGNRLEWST